MTIAKAEAVQAPGAGDIAAAPMPMEVGGAKVPYGRLLRFAWVLVKGSLGVLAGMVAFSTFVQLLTQYNSQILSSLTAMLSSSAAGTAGAPAEKKGGGMLDFMLPGDLQSAAIVFAVTAILMIVLIFGERIYAAWSDNLIATRLQQRLHDKLLALGPDFHRKHDLSETSLTVTAFAPGAQQIACDLIAFPVVRGIGLVTAILFLIHNLQALHGAPVWMQIVLIASVVVLPFAGWWFSQGIVRSSRRLVDQQTAVANEFMNSAANPTEIRLMGAERQRAASFGDRLRRLRAAAVAAAVKRELGTQFQAAVPRILSAAFLLYGIFFALRSGDASAVGAIVAFVLFIPLAVNPINELLTFFIGISATWPQIEKVVEIAEAPEEQEISGARPLAPSGSGAVAFDGVTFAYNPATPPVLRGLSHAFADGKISAIIARSGAGKSTILNLIARQYRPQAGTIRLGGDDVAGVTTESLRGAVVKISQFPVFLADTVRANFKLAKADATDAEIEEVCRRTGLWPILVNAAAGGRPLETVLPRKLETLISGGQQKLFAVTRGLLRKPRVLLIDEPTTGIDNIGIAELSKFLRPACQGVTAIVVDHKMSFVGQFADVICCMEEGRFADVGTPAELDRPGTLYHQLKELERNEPAAGAPGAAPVAEALDLPPGAMLGPDGMPMGPMKKEKGGMAGAMIVDPASLPPGMLPPHPGGPMPGPMKKKGAPPAGGPPEGIGGLEAVPLGAPEPKPKRG
ncbi:MAG: ABC transporter ATP-binding protein [Candidatus Odyssella sp.]|nr:ABC transporter ATP-binding protein [Candidatus Odyssella sp.]